MLLIGQPKSASTSLVYTLAHYTQCEAKTVLEKKHKKYRMDNNHLTRAEMLAKKRVCVPAKEEFDLPGPDYRTYPKQLLEELVNSKSEIWRLHIPPTVNNIANIKGLPFILLTRSPLDSTDAFERHMPEHFDKDVRQNLIAKKNRHKVVDALKRWKEGWVKSNTNHIHIHFHNLVSQPERELERALDFLGYPNTQNIELQKRRYTR